LLEQHDGWRAASLSNRVGAKPPIEAVPPQQALIGMLPTVTLRTCPCEAIAKDIQHVQH
jgi:hypothetical protein